MTGAEHRKPVALITGSSGGIGRATVQIFHDAGWLTVGVDLTPPAQEAPDRFVIADLGEPDVAEHVFAAIPDIGRIDALVNNAALQLTRTLADTTADDWQQLMNVNLRAAALLTQAVACRMAPQGGAIVNVASVHAVATSAGMPAYVASKGALVALTRACALELAAQGVRVNAVLPGAVDTAMLTRGLGRGAAPDALDGARAALASRTPLGRLGAPEDIAQAILFFADEGRSSFITGQTLVVDGGATARLSTE